MRQTPCSLAGKRAPGTDGTEFSGLAHSRRNVIVSSGGVDEMAITVGCFTLTLGADEAEAIANEVLRKLKEMKA